VATVVGLFVSPARGSGRSEARERVTAVAGHGFEGCAHAGRPRREVLFVAKEHVDALNLEPGTIRENVLVDGADVQSWPVGQRVQAGSALFEITMVCDPCHKMDRLRPGLRAELDGRRGMLALVVEGGEIALGDAVEPA
jgi:MOSC domain-containing protein YiiM